MTDRLLRLLVVPYFKFGINYLVVSTFFGVSTFLQVGITVVVDFCFLQFRIYCIAFSCSNKFLYLYLSLSCDGNPCHSLAPLCLVIAVVLNGRGHTLWLLSRACQLQLRRGF